MPRPRTMHRSRQAAASGGRWFCTALLLAVAAPVWAEGVVIVLGSKAKPYGLAGAAAAKSLAGREQSCRIMLLDNVINKTQSIDPTNDAIIAVGTRAAVHLHRTLPAGPLLTYCMVADPASRGLTQGSRARGVTTDIPAAQQYELLSRALPSVRSVGMLYKGREPRSRAFEKSARLSLPDKWQLHAVDVDNHRSVAEAIDRLLSRPIDIVWTAPDSTVYDIPTVKALLLASIRRGKPVFGFSPPFVRAGALLGVGIDPAEQGRQVAELTHSLLEPTATGSADAADKDGAARRPVEPRFQVAVNLIVAKKLGIRLPRSLIREAAYVFGNDKKGTR